MKVFLTDVEDGQPAELAEQPGRTLDLVGMQRGADGANLAMHVIEPKKGAREVFGDLYFPERAEFKFNGSLSALKKLVRSAWNCDGVIHDPRFTYWT